MAIIWECALRKPERVGPATDILIVWLRSSSTEVEIGETDVIAAERR
ncbi:hypothetical protein [Rhodobaculum claviforme]